MDIFDIASIAFGVWCISFIIYNAVSGMFFSSPASDAQPEDDWVDEEVFSIGPPSPGDMDYVPEHDPAAIECDELNPYYPYR
jgi:hypothetical protein